MIDPEQQAELDAALRAIFERHRSSLTQQVADIEEAVSAAMGGELDPAAAELARQSAHKLAGAGGMFGLHRSSEVAMELQRAFRDPRPTSPAWVTSVAELTVELAESVESEASPPAEDMAPADDGPVVLLGLGDESFAAAVAAEAARGGLHVRTLSDDDDRGPAMRPDVAVVSAAGPAPGQSVDQVLAQLAGLDQPVPTIVVIGPDDPADRVELSRRGARGFLTRPIRPGRVVEAVQELLESRRLADVTVVAVDDDPAILAVIERLLADEGVTVETVDDPSRFWEVFQRVEPDLLVLDVEMPGVGGIELCRVIRSDPAWNQVSIVFLTGHRDHETVTRVFDAGGDDYLTKPINAPEVVARIANRLERIRLTRQLADTDPLTGVASRPRAHEVFEGFVAHADRYGEPVAVAVIDLDGFRALNETHGHAAGDEVLRDLGARLLRAFPAGDLVARWGGQEFLVAMPGMTRTDGVDRLAEVLEVHRDGRLPKANRNVASTFSAGLAAYPDDAGTLHGLYLAAGGAARTARQAGGNRIFRAGQDIAAASGQRDVVVVEDDATLASILLQALRTRGWTTSWFGDGEQASAALTAATPDVQARVIVLDWDLPGLDGPSVLHRVAERGLLGDTRVIMLTAHSQEDEILRTLELGAFDHVAKPFSVPVLMQRIRRALVT